MLAEEFCIWFFTTFRMRYTFCKHFYRRIHIFYKKNNNNKTNKQKNQNETKQNKTKTNKQKISNNNKQKDKITVFIFPSMSCQSMGFTYDFYANRWRMCSISYYFRNSSVSINNVTNVNYDIEKKTNWIQRKYKNV
jgi:uncharacterized ion transporter superfamily protein YfcC